MSDMTGQMTPMQDPYKAAATVPGPFPPPPVASSVDRIVDMLKNYVDARDQQTMDIVDQTVEHLVARLDEQAAAIAQLQYEVRILGGIGADDYRRFIVEEARLMGVKPSDLMKKGEDDGRDG